MGVKLLWSSTSGMMMSDSQSCTLSESISEQAHGIVLHWVYRDGDNYAQNQQHQFVFFPKTVVDEDYWGTTGGGKVMFLTTISGRFAAKYVYITDDAINGSSYNNSSAYAAVSEGVTLYPQYFSLVEILGV